MDTFEVLNNLLVKLFNDILDVEEKAIITDEFKDISVTDMHIIEAVNQRKTCIERSKDSKRRGREKTTE